MVVIVDGDVVADDDPRAVALRRRNVPQSTSNPPRSSSAAPRRDSTPFYEAPDHPLASIENALKLQDARIDVPETSKTRAARLPVVYVVAAGAATVLGGWRIAALCCVVFVAQLWK